jgi:thiamine monophosphate kinase
MKLTPAIIRNLYSAIYCMKPFDRWDMPLPEEIDFIVDKDKEVMGTYLYDTGEDYEHTITISSAKCGHLDTVIRVLCHECIHMSRHKTNRWTYHDKEFRNRAFRISSELGFDPLEL